MSDLKKIDKMIPIDRQKFAYQCEPLKVTNVARICASVPYNGGKEPYPNGELSEIQKYDSYELLIANHTGNSMTVDFRKRFEDGSVIVYTTTMSFAELVNQIFKNVEVSEIIERDKFGESYPTNPAK